MIEKLEKEIKKLKNQSNLDLLKKIRDESFFDFTQINSIIELLENLFISYEIKTKESSYYCSVSEKQVPIKMIIVEFLGFFYFCISKSPNREQVALINSTWAYGEDQTFISSYNNIVNSRNIKEEFERCFEIFIQSKYGNLSETMLRETLKDPKIAYQCLYVNRNFLKFIEIVPNLDYKETLSNLKKKQLILNSL